MKYGDAPWKITLLHILQEVRTIYKTRNQLTGKPLSASGQSGLSKGTRTLSRHRRDHYAKETGAWVLRAHVYLRFRFRLRSLGSFAGATAGHRSPSLGAGGGKPRAGSPFWAPAPRGNRAVWHLYGAPGT